MNHAHQEMEEKLQNMQPENMQYYEDLYDEIQLLQVEGQKKESEIMRLRNNIFEIESSMRGGTNELKLQYKEVKSLQAELLEKKEGVKEQLILSDLDPKEKKAYLLAKVKKNQARSNELDQTLTRMKSEKNKLQHKHQELESNLRGGTHQGESEYLPTRQNEQEMITFFETFQENKARILQEQKDSKINILSLLNNISNRISSTREDLPTKEEYKDMKSEVTFKEIHLKANELTMKKLQEQKKIRIEELRKIDALEGNIDSEELQLKERKKLMEEEIDRFNNISSFQRAGRDTKDYLNSLILEYTEKLEATGKLVKKRSSELEESKKAIEVNSYISKDLESLEQKLRHQSQNIFNLQDFINEKSRQTDFESMKKKCLEIVEDLNILKIQ